MGRYVGETFKIPLEQGGFCHNKNIDTIAPGDMVHPSKNIWLNEGGVRKRGGTAYVDSNIMFTIPDPTHDGSGLDDLSSGTVFTHTGVTTYTIEIDGTGTPDTFKWMETGGSWTETVSVTGSEQTLSHGFKITFAATTGHTLADEWTIAMDAPEVMGIHHHLLANGTEKIVRITADGKMWKTDALAIKTGLGTSKVPYFSQWGDELIVANGNHIPFTWDGTGSNPVNFANVPTDWTGTNYPKQIILHGRGNSMRGWALGCPLNPKNLYVSANDDPTDFTQATVLVFQIETGDGAGIVAGKEFGDRLFLLGKTHSFVFNDDSVTTSSWGYVGAQWVGGVAHHRLIVETPNDLIAMMANGEIYSIATAEQYGDYKAASITRPSFMHEWIKSYVKLSSVSSFHAIYDPVIRAVKVFVIKSGSTEIDTCLCYFIDRPPAKAWVILDNLSFESGYSASSATLAKLSTGWKVYTGSYNGRVWKLGEVNRNDNSNAFQSCYKTPPLGFENTRESKRYDRAKLVAVRSGSCDATLTWWVDGQEKDSEVFEYSSIGGRLGSFILGSSPLGGVNILEKDVKLGCLGKRIQLAITNNTADQNFFFSQLMIDFLPLGKRL